MRSDVKYVHETDVHNLKAPRKVVPLLLELFSPRSVLDVGCGIGTWLSVFKENGVKDIYGVDGNYVNKNLLLSYINSEEFQPLDISAPFDLDKKYDLAICLEVAEHLEEAAAESLIENLSRHSSTIVFGAAIPHQGGQNHLNEQWPEYWRKIFKGFGYDCYDILRRRIWDDADIDWWYKQNTFVFTNTSLEEFDPSDSFLSIIHPEHFNQKVKYINELNEKVFFLTERVKGLENDRSDIRRNWSIFFSSLSRKFSNRK